MGFKAGTIVKGKVDPNAGLPSLSPEDCLYLLNIIRKTEFKGADVEKLFNLTLKIQEMFVFLNKKK
tara:strand:- start:2222 stop:2419 length:198 start_codon:yes stop_codon:yes gene_type:complete